MDLSLTSMTTHSPQTGGLQFCVETCITNCGQTVPDTTMVCTTDSIMETYHRPTQQYHCLPIGTFFPQKRASQKIEIKTAAKYSRYMRALYTRPLTPRLTCHKHKWLPTPIRALFSTQWENWCTERRLRSSVSLPSCILIRFLFVCIRYNRNGMIYCRRIEMVARKFLLCIIMTSTAAYCSLSTGMFCCVFSLCDVPG